ncbi:ATP-dependent protease ATPase subunit HslU [Clostridium sp. D2Q-11]|uniref:ATP-dependent protease ATPase subunit HslU n=1 Tax=Anaeromonas frigoriresistens TaxID=2683708 RepID=A0A942V4Q8_9FIRM|nr:ATP-dependent protease ATPase subunit HslU [Anaeromonas frigoriresistens]MBS4539837.1 ATP-dependent protease ATPase subunit HslU [Anaeromonas frigoriresistens]
MEGYTPIEIVEKLNNYIIGQDKAKKSVAIALRNRYRRNKLNDEFREEVKPKNIIMMGPTGVGKTEIARRLAKIENSPFVKVEATKFTEVGYVGRDVESMIRDLVETSIRLVKNEKISKVYDKAQKLAEERILKNLINGPEKKKDKMTNPFEAFFGSNIDNDNNNDDEESEIHDKGDRKIIEAKLKNKEIEDQYIEIEVQDNSANPIGMINTMGMDDLNMNDVFSGLLPKKKKNRKVTIKEARNIIANEEAQKMIDMDDIISIAIEKAENHGIIFIDEIDKIAGRGGSGPDVSREGVQRDILPIIEGCTVMSKYGPIKTDHILFVAAGAFHVSKITDLIPEIQGRFPIRVKLHNLTEENFIEILTKPQNALIKQYQLLLKTENVELEFTEEGIKEIAKTAYIINDQTENIGARRLHTILEELLEELSFNAPTYQGQKFIIDKDYVKEKLKDSMARTDMSKYIL